MRVASIGDLHLGPSPALDGFGGDEAVLLRLLDQLERDHDEVLLLGDIVGTDYGPTPGSSAEVLHQTLQRYRTTSARWRRGPYTFVFGNHDPVTEQELGAHEVITLEQDGFRVRWSHGHQHDPLLLGPLPQLCTWSIGGLRRLGAGGVGDFLEGHVYQLGQSMAEPKGASEQAAAVMLAQGEADVVVMGHTHRAMCQSWGRGAYANAGKVTACTPRYVSVDLSAREVRLLELSGSGPREISAWGAT